jgi:hypothetical protein
MNPRWREIMYVFQALARKSLLLACEFWLSVMGTHPRLVSRHCYLLLFTCLVDTQLLWFLGACPSYARDYYILFNFFKNTGLPPVCHWQHNSDTSDRLDLLCRARPTHPWSAPSVLLPHPAPPPAVRRTSLRLRRWEREDEEKRTAGYIVVLVNKQTLQLRALPGPIFHKSIYPDHDSTCKEIIFLTSFIFSIKMLFNCIK